MKIEDYPPQEPFSEIGLAYLERTHKLSAGLEGIEVPLGEDPYQSLALYPADEPNGCVLAFMFGGGWTNGYKETMAFVAPPLNAQGITVASLGYRLAPQHTFPAGWLDAASGIQWLYHHVVEYGGDPDKLFVGGHSAGGHYASLLAVRRDWQLALALPEDVIRGCLPISGTYDFGRRSGLAIRPRFLGPESEQNEVVASPINYLHVAPPPFFLAHGDHDFPHLIEQSRQFEVALGEAGGDVSSLVVPGCDHFTVCFSAGLKEGLWSRTAIEWMSSRCH